MTLMTTGLAIKPSKSEQAILSNATYACRPPGLALRTCRLGSPGARCPSATSLPEGSALLPLGTFSIIVLFLGYSL